MKFYAVAVGRVPGIYTSWPEAQKQIHGYSGAKYKSFSEKSQAETYMKLFVHRDEEKKEDRHIIYTDGSAVNGTAGAAAVSLEKKLVYYGRPSGEQTNNRGELSGIRLALCFEGSLLIYSDSEYAIGVITGSLAAKKNLDLIEIIRKEMAGRDIVFRKVLAHSGVEGNELADHYADKGRSLSEGTIVQEKL